MKGQHAKSQSAFVIRHEKGRPIYWETLDPDERTAIGKFVSQYAVVVFQRRDSWEYWQSVGFVIQKVKVTMET